MAMKLLLKKHVLKIYHKSVNSCASLTTVWVCEDCLVIIPLSLFFRWVRVFWVFIWMSMRKSPGMLSSFSSLGSTMEDMWLTTGTDVYLPLTSTNISVLLLLIRPSLSEFTHKKCYEVKWKRPLFKKN